jgi:CubicO group peptidase (beta-lactamase class C family)
MVEKKGERWTPAPESYGTGGGLCGSATELAQLYHCLLSGGTSSSIGSPILDTTSLQKFTQRWREGEFDSTFRHIVDFGLGIIVDSNRYGPTTIPYGFGTHSSQIAYGHGGARSSIAFADPQKKIAVALCLIGLAPENVHQPRMRAILDQLRSDLA